MLIKIGIIIRIGLLIGIGLLSVIRLTIRIGIIIIIRLFDLHISNLLDPRLTVDPDSQDHARFGGQDGLALFAHIIFPAIEHPGSYAQR